MKETEEEETEREREAERDQSPFTDLLLKCLQYPGLGQAEVRRRELCVGSRRQVLQPSPAASQGACQQHIGIKK